MELDSLKEIWKKTEVRETAPVIDSEIATMLGKTSFGPIERMKRNVLLEAILLIVLFGSVAVFYLNAFSGEFKSIAWVYIITAAFSIYFYYRKWRLLIGMQCFTCQVKSNLQRQVNKLERYVRFYLLANTVLVPAVFVFLAYLFYYKFPAGSWAPVFPKHITVATWLGWTGSVLLATILSFFVFRRYVNKLYGQHIQQLKRVLKQMED